MTDDPVVVPPLETVKARLVATVKSLAMRKIIAIVPEWKQRNLLARATQLLRKKEANWTAGDLAAWNAGQAIWDRIVAIRSASDVGEGDIAAAPDAMASSAMEPVIGQVDGSGMK